MKTALSDRIRRLFIRPSLFPKHANQQQKCSTAHDAARISKVPKGRVNPNNRRIKHCHLNTILCISFITFGSSRLTVVLLLFAPVLLAPVICVTRAVKTSLRSSLSSHLTSSKHSFVVCMGSARKQSTSKAKNNHRTSNASISHRH